MRLVSPSSTLYVIAYIPEQNRRRTKTKSCGALSFGYTVLQESNGTASGDATIKAGESSPREEKKILLRIFFGLLS
jgi:hypothetical protein